jgi:uncharacterized protein (UPF0335 family)
MTTEPNAAAEIRAFVERIEAANERISEETADRRDVYAEAKSRGYDAAVLRAIVRMRKQKPDDLAEFEALLDLYSDAVGLK